MITVCYHSTKGPEWQDIDDERYSYNNNNTIRTWAYLIQSNIDEYNMQNDIRGATRVSLSVPNAELTGLDSKLINFTLEVFVNYPPHDF